MSHERNDDHIEFLSTGARAKGQYRCSECGYGVTVFRQLPTCPMCAGILWEQALWSPFARAALD